MMDPVDFLTLHFLDGSKVCSFKTRKVKSALGHKMLLLPSLLIERAFPVFEINSIDLKY